jgi:hypothetical protein
MMSYTFERYLISKLTLTYLTLCPLPFAGPGRPPSTQGIVSGPHMCPMATMLASVLQIWHTKPAIGLKPEWRPTDALCQIWREVQDTVLSSMLSKRPSDSSENSLSAPQPPPKVPRISTTRASRLGQELPQLQSCAPVDAHSNNTVSSLQIVPVSGVSTALQASACLDPTSLQLQDSIPTAPLPLLRGTVALSGSLALLSLWCLGTLGIRSTTSLS